MRRPRLDGIRAFGWAMVLGWLLALLCLLLYLTTKGTTP